MTFNPHRIERGPHVMMFEDGIWQIKSRLPSGAYTRGELPNRHAAWNKFQELIR